MNVFGTIYISFWVFFMVSQRRRLMDVTRGHMQATREKIKFVLRLTLIIPLALGVVTLATTAANLVTLPIVAFLRYLLVPTAIRTAFASAFPMLSSIAPGFISAASSSNEFASKYNNGRHANSFDSNDTNAAIAGAAVTLGAGISSYAPAVLAATLTGPVSLVWMGATSLVAGAGMTFGFSLKRAILGGNPLFPDEDENVPAPADLGPSNSATNRLDMV